MNWLSFSDKSSRHLCYYYILQADGNDQAKNAVYLWQITWIKYQDEMQQKKYQSDQI